MFRSFVFFIDATIFSDNKWQMVRLHYEIYRLAFFSMLTSKKVTHLA